MDFEKFFNSAVKTYKSMANSAANDFKKMLRSKSDQEIMTAYQRMNRSKPEYKLVCEEAERRNLI